MTEYACPACTWVGTKYRKIDALNMKVCPECTTRVEPVDPDAVETARKIAAADDEPAATEPSIDWDWNPTMRAGPNGPELEPGACEGYHNKHKQR